MKTRIQNVYQFEELGDAAKEKARRWWRESLCYDEWWDSTYEDAERAGIKITSFDLDRADITGKFIEDACNAAHAIVDDHGPDCETFKTATKFLAERDKLVDEWPRDEDGEIDDEREMDSQLDEIESEFLHDILEDYLIMLRKEIEYQESDEQVDEAITINEYDFDIDGNRI